MLEEFLKAQAELPRGGHRSWFETAQLDEGQREALVEAMRRPDVSDTAVQVVLARWGVKVTRQQVGHLRRKMTDG